MKKIKSKSLDSILGLESGLKKIKWQGRYISIKASNCMLYKTCAYRYIPKDCLGVVYLGKDKAICSNRIKEGDVK